MRIFVPVWLPNCPSCLGEAEARRDAQIKEAIAEEERMASR